MARKRLIKAYLIDVVEKEIREVEYENNLEEIYKLLDCKLIDRFYLSNGFCVYFDDEGAFTDKDSFYTQDIEIIGNGLVVGTDFKDGETISVDCPIEDIKALVNFKGSEFNHWIRTFFKEKDIPLSTELEAGCTLLLLIRALDSTSKNIQDEVKRTIIEIYSSNGDVLDFMNYMSKMAC